MKNLENSLDFGIRPVLELMRLQSFKIIILGYVFAHQISIICSQEL